MKRQVMALIVGISFLLGCGTQEIAEEAKQPAETVQTAELKTTGETEQTTETEQIAELKITEETEQSTKPVMMEETEQLAETVSAEAETVPEAYREILNRAYKILCAESEPLEGEIGVTGISEVMIGNGDEIYHVGYQLIDIDGNGTEELIIAEMAEGDWNNRILAMYTQKEDEPILLAEGWVRNRFFLLDDGTIYNEGSNGAAYTIFCTYQMAEDGLSMEVIDYYFTYEKDNFTGESAWFHNTTGEWDRDKSEMLSVEEENKPMEMMEEYLARVRTLDVTYFSEF